MTFLYILNNFALTNKCYVCNEYLATFMISHRFFFAILCLSTCQLVDLPTSRLNSSIRISSSGNIFIIHNPYTFVQNLPLTP